MVQSFSCPNCGSAQAPAFAAARMMTCDSCGTTLFLDDSVFRDVGHAGEMHDAPQLVSLHQDVRLFGRVWHVLGHARYSYGRGHWDEYWAEAEGGGAWISVDEGDVVVQRALPRGVAPAPDAAPKIGTEIEITPRPGHSEMFRVTEAETATCLAIRGSFPEALEVGETHHFINADGEFGALLSGEFWDGGSKWFLGDWVNPFEVEQVGAA